MIYISTLRNAIDYNDMMNQYDGAEMDKEMYKHEQDNQKQSKESGIQALYTILESLKTILFGQARVM